MLCPTARQNEDATPLGLWPQQRSTQGSRSAPTLGFEAESLWDSELPYERCGLITRAEARAPLGAARGVHAASTDLCPTVRELLQRLSCGSRGSGLKPALPPERRRRSRRFNRYAVPRRKASPTRLLRQTSVEFLHQLCFVFAGISAAEESIQRFFIEPFPGSFFVARIDRIKQRPIRSSRFEIARSIANHENLFGRI